MKIVADHIYTEAWGEDLFSLGDFNMSQPNQDKYFASKLQ